MSTFADFVDQVPTRAAFIADVVVNRHALARSNDCREIGAIIVVVNECVGILSGVEARFKVSIVKC